MLLELHKATYHVSKRKLLDDADITINEKERIAIVGRNGCGKSTLMNLLAGKDDLHAGTRTISKNTRILLVKQNLPNDDTTPLEFLRQSDIELSALNKQLDTAEDTQIGDIYDQIALIDEQRYEVLAPKVLVGLGLTLEEQSAPMKNLSGGLRMRIALASALVQQPDVLLLDEPTNHLDLEATVWLTEFLKEYPKAFVVISHDRNILNDLTKITYHLQSGKLTRYNGNFDLYKEEYVLKREQAATNNEKLEKRNEDLDKFIKRFGPKPSWSRMAESRKKSVARNNEMMIEITEEEPPIPIDFPECAVLGDPIVDLQKASVGYGKRTVLSKLDLSIQKNARIGFLGRNGQGKSTLVRLIVGKLELTSGLLLKNPKLRIGYFSQDQTDVLEKNLTVYEQLKKICENKTDEELRQHLASFGFDSKKVDTQIENLSGGEKSRLLFAIISAQNPQLIIMDEPTNHLDIEARDALIEAIEQFNGAVVLVSHDWHLLEKSMKDFWLVSNGSVKIYSKGIEHYKSQLLQEIRENRLGTTSTSTTSTTSTKQDDKKSTQASAKIGFHGTDNNKKGNNSKAEEPPKKSKKATVVSKR